jgi:hypothetical protein
MDTVVKIVRDAGVKRLIGALQDIDNPVRWFVHRSY